jgi:hypothetical protein
MVGLSKQTDSHQKWFADRLSPTFGMGKARERRTGKINALRAPYMHKAGALSLV